MKHLHGIASGNLWSARGRYPQMKRPPALLRESTELRRPLVRAGFSATTPGDEGAAICCATHARRQPGWSSQTQPQSSQSDHFMTRQAWQDFCHESSPHVRFGQASNSIEWVWSGPACVIREIVARRASFFPAETRAHIAPLLPQDDTTQVWLATEGDLSCLNKILVG
jgi:hypothetical protein